MYRKKIVIFNFNLLFTDDPEPAVCHGSSHVIYSSSHAPGLGSYGPALSHSHFSPQELNAAAISDTNNITSVEAGLHREFMSDGRAQRMGSDW